MPLNSGDLLLQWEGNELKEGKNSDLDWEYLINYFTKILVKKNKGTFWKAEVQNYGWQKLSGKKVFKARTGGEFLRQILPNTECSFKIYSYEEGFAIQNSHHDNCTGDEWYYITPISVSEYEKNCFYIRQED